MRRHQRSSSSEVAAKHLTAARDCVGAVLPSRLSRAWSAERAALLVAERLYAAEAHVGSNDRTLCIYLRLGELEWSKPLIDKKSDPTKRINVHTGRKLASTST